MNKLRRDDYLQLICEAIVSEYGNTLVEDDTDLRMARKVLHKLQRYLSFHPLKNDKKEFEKWRREFKRENGIEDELTEKELIEQDRPDLPATLYGNGAGIEKDVWFDKPTKYELVFRDDDWLYVPVGDKKSSRKKGGVCIFADEDNVDNVMVEQDCVVFLTAKKKNAQSFIVAAKKVFAEIDIDSIVEEKDLSVPFYNSKFKDIFIRKVKLLMKKSKK